MNNNFLVIFNINKYDLNFSFSYRKIGKKFKNIQEYWTTNINYYNSDKKYFDNININNFKNIKILLARLKQNNYTNFNLHFVKQIAYNITINNFNKNIVAIYDFFGDNFDMFDNLKLYIITTFGFQYRSFYYKFKNMNLYRLHAKNYITISTDIINNYLKIMYPFDLSINFLNNNTLKHMFLNTWHNFNYSLDYIKHMNPYKLYVSMHYNMLHELKQFDNLHTLSIEAINNIIDHDDIISSKQLYTFYHNGFIKKLNNKYYDAIGYNNN